MKESFLLVKISIIVPVLNESSSIKAMMGHWQKLQASRAELVFVDGGSTDGTVGLLQKGGMSAIPSARGRAVQMNTGAEQASGDILLFLHADTFLPDEALGLVEKTSVWGRFDVRIEGEARLFPLISFLINLRSRLSGIATGDQALFMTRDAFDRVGRFPEQPLMEDIEISKRLKRLSRPLCLRVPVRTSGRRWEKRGVWNTIFLMWRLRFAYWRGVPATELVKEYQ
jgi:rSAM/selenodomain-associated transferase 2